MSVLLRGAAPSDSRGVFRRASTCAKGTSLGRLGPPGLGLGVGVGLALATATAGAQGATPSPTHPIYVQPEGAPATDQARRSFEASIARLRMEPLQIAEAPAPERAHFAPKLQAARALVAKLDFAAARPALETLVQEVIGAGAGDLEMPALADLYLTRAWARSGATFRGDLPLEPEARSEAYQDLLRAATLEPGRVLNEQQYPPALVADWKKAAAEAAQRPAGTLTVKGSASAIAYLDGGSGRPCPAAFENTRFGEHVVRVEELTHAPWGTSVALTSPTAELDVPIRPVLTLTDAEAGAFARQMAKSFALVADPEVRHTQIVLGLRLVDRQGKRVDASTIALDRSAANGALDAALVQLDNEARALAGAPPAPSGVAPLSAPPSIETPAQKPPVLVSPAPKPTFSEDPVIWARDHWPVLVAVGAFVTVGLVLTIAVSH